MLSEAMQAQGLGAWCDPSGAGAAFARDIGHHLSNYVRTREMVEPSKSFQPLTEVSAFVPDNRDPNRLGGECSVNNFSVRWTSREDALRGCACRIVVYVLRRVKLISDALKVPDKMSLIYAFRERLRVTEKQAFVLVKLEVGNKAKVRPEVRDLLAYIIFESSFDMANLLQIGEMVWRRGSRESIAQAIKIDHCRAVRALVLFQQDSHIAADSGVIGSSAFMAGWAEENRHGIDIARPKNRGENAGNKRFLSLSFDHDV